VASFDIEKWRARAWKRHQARASRNNGVYAYLSYMEELLAVERMSRLVEWCNKKKLGVRFEKRDNASYYSETREIVITTHASPVYQLYYMLHECGHFLIGGNSERFAMGYPAIGTHASRTFHHRIACLEEEFEAWNRGWSLAQRLKLGISREQFDDIRVKCLKTYVKWAGGK
jgi:hypothetical protein